ncbi:MAG: acylphosphatase [Bacteroidia bacterium]|nr:acylphosphatase [Bacteroidia bacterium]HQV00232.1 acylphosphatase [Bacteroidia bacterium]
MQCSLIVTGQVQQVFYRKYTVAKALELGITGYVENRNDGSVHIVANGNADSLTALENWCYTGSPLSKVIEVKRFENAEVLNENTFVQH